VTNCFTTGVADAQGDGTTENCFAVAEVHNAEDAGTTSYRHGGLVGYVDYGGITQGCYAMGM